MSTTTPHTPGPWTACKANASEYFILAEGLSAAPVATVHLFPRDGETKANAALIAASPDLLASCKSLIEIMSAFYHSPNTSFCECCRSHAPKDNDGRLMGPVPHREDCEWVAARAVIAQAEGRP